MTMIYNEEIYQIQVSKAEDQNKQVELFDMPLFSQQWFDEDSEQNIQDDIPTFTF